MQSNVSLSEFLASAPGRYVLRWEKAHLDGAVADIFGYHAVQLGVPSVDMLAENRMPLRLCLSDQLESVLVQAGPGAPPEGGRRVAVITRFEELPFSAQSIDLVVMPHVLEFAEEPHQVLREVDRVLVPDGHVIVTGFNPASLWGARQAMMRLGARPFLPPASQFISLPRIKDWLKLLSFEASRGRFGCYAPWAGGEAWLSRWGFMEKAGDRWWPFLGSVYMLTAVKRIRGMRLIGPVWRRKDERRAALAPAATQRNTDGCTVRVVKPGEAANDTARDAAHG
jgi:SAM-dependent methyltransferase